MANAPNDDGRMPFFEHIRELRDRARGAAIAFAVAFVGCWFFSQQIYDWLRAPVDQAWMSNAAQLGAHPVLVFSKPTEPFWIYMSVSMWAGIFVSSPFIFYQLWRFIAPGLYQREKRIGMAFAVFSAVFFISGALFCYYFVLGNLYSYLLEYGVKDKLIPQLNMAEYFDLTKDMMLAFGGVFELPLLIYFLAMVGLVTHRSLWKFNRWFIVLAFIIGAILTPSPDVVSQVMMAVPMIALYNLSILAAFFVVRGKEKKKEAQKAREREADALERAKRKAKQDAGEPVEDDDGEPGDE
ncbi:MAG: twin-arginine translocase subunit TatC [Deltaproteobacteria bacterium]|nr:twin-arginine translocase subunit TatC [Deltaproteobacteria bacterium]